MCCRLGIFQNLGTEVENELLQRIALEEITQIGITKGMVKIQRFSDFLNSYHNQLLFGYYFY